MIKMQEMDLKNLLMKMIQHKKLKVELAKKDNEFFTYANCVSDLFYSDLFVIIRKSVVNSFNDLIDTITYQILNNQDYNSIMRYSVIKSEVPFTNLPMYYIYDMQEEKHVMLGNGFEDFYENEEDAYNALYSMIKEVELNEKFATM